MIFGILRDPNSRLNYSEQYMKVDESYRIGEVSWKVGGEGLRTGVELCEGEFCRVSELEPKRTRRSFAVITFAASVFFHHQHSH